MQIFQTIKKMGYFIVLMLITINLFAQDDYSWVIVDSLLTARDEHSITPLNNGNIIVSGGYVNIGGKVKTCEKYDCESNKWKSLSPMNKSRAEHSTILLDNGLVLAVCGGSKNISCELYDDSSNTWSYTDSINLPRQRGQTLTKLNNGNILLLGGSAFDDQSHSYKYFDECEIYLVKEKRWVIVDSLNVGRMNHTVTLLLNGKVLVTGGNTNFGQTASCEIYDPELDVWTFVDSLPVKQSYHAAILQNDGNVFVSGLDIGTLVYNTQNSNWDTVNNYIIAKDNHRKYYIDNSTLLVLGSDHFELLEMPSHRSIGLGYYPVDKIHSNNSTQTSNGTVYIIGGPEWIYDSSGTPLLMSSNSCLMYNKVTDIANELNTVKNFQLLQNYPNPFNPVTTIKYCLNKNCFVSIKIYSLSGELICTLLEKYIQAGIYQIEFDGSQLSSGIYFYRLTANDISQSKKMILLK